MLPPPPPVSHGKYADGTDRRMDAQTANCYITHSARGGQHNNKWRWWLWTVLVAQVSWIGVKVGSHQPNQVNFHMCVIIFIFNPKNVSHRHQCSRQPLLNHADCLNMRWMAGGSKEHEHLRLTSTMSSKPIHVNPFNFLASM